MVHRFIFIFLLLSFFTNTYAQFELSSYVDAGKNNVSDGLFVKNATGVTYRFNDYKITTIAQLNITPNERIFSAWRADVGKKIIFFKQALDVKMMFLWNSESALLYETNVGLLFEYEYKQFDFSLGSHFRTYAPTSFAIKKYDLNADNKIHENWNLLYLISYAIKPRENQWNVSLSVSNYDYCLFNQETNLIFGVRGVYNMQERFKRCRLFSEMLYKSAGASNMSVNPFGYLYRLGVICKL